MKKKKWFIYLSKGTIKQYFYKILSTKTAYFQMTLQKYCEKYKLKNWNKNCFTKIFLVFCKCKK